MTKKSALTQTQLSLENAEQWLEDAKMLIGKGSYGRANALLRFSLEELAKAWVCWQVSKEIMPENSKPYRDVFKDHIMKNQIIIAFVRPPGSRVEETRKEETERLQSRTEYLLKFVKSLVIRSPPEYEKRLKDAYASLPKDVWKTGEIPRKHLAIYKRC